MPMQKVKAGTPATSPATQVNVPKVNVPKVNVPQQAAPQAQAPKVNVPKVNVPRVNAPQAAAPSPVTVPAIAQRPVAAGAPKGGPGKKGGLGGKKTKKITLGGKKAQKQTTFGVNEGGRTTYDSFIHLLFEHLKAQGLELESKKALTDIMKAAEEVLINITAVSSFKFMGAMFKPRHNTWRLYKLKTTELATFVPEHIAVSYRRYADPDMMLKILAGRMLDAEGNVVEDPKQAAFFQPATFVLDEKGEKAYTGEWEDPFPVADTSQAIEAVAGAEEETAPEASDEVTDGAEEGPADDQDDTDGPSAPDDDEEAEA